jgi:hypothetical protein
MCTGVTNGFANRKFSGSVIRLGVNRTMDMNAVRAIKYPSASFEE